MRLQAGGLARLPEGARAEVFRAAAARLGAVLDHAGTRLALEVTSHGASGKAVDLGGGLRFGREFETVVFQRGTPRQEDRELEIEAPGVGAGDVILGGRSWAVEWSDAEPPDASVGATLLVDRSGFPLKVRGWCAGDRIRLPYGTKKLKELFRESRVPRSARSRRPVVVDASGTVLWVPGVAQSADATEGTSGGPTEGGAAGASEGDTVPARGRDARPLHVGVGTTTDSGIEDA